MSYPPFHVWLSDKLGSRRWCVEPRLTDRLRARGFECAVPASRFAQYENEWAEGHPRMAALADLPASTPHRDWLIGLARDAVKRGGV